jgi:hypothetical protein
MKLRLNIRSLVLTAAAGAAAIASTSAYPAGATSSGDDFHTTAKLTFAHNVDVAPHGPSAGDSTTFGGRLIGPDLKGRYQAYCVNVTRTSQQCSEAIISPGGQIAAQAVYGAGGTALTPIVGGSGRYASARGDMAEREVDNGREVRLVLHLER